MNKTHITTAGQSTGQAYSPAAVVSTARTALLQAWREAGRALEDDRADHHFELRRTVERMAMVLGFLGAKLPETQVLDVDDPAFDDRMAGAPGEAVPATLRPWSVACPAHAPLDITPPELLGDGLAASVAQGWAEPYATPADVPDWEKRQARALVPFALDERGWPLNPTGRTGRSGRNLGKWGENAAADPVVVAGTGSAARVLLIRRADCGQWAIPGGMVEPGNSVPKTLARELREENGVDLAALSPQILATL